MKYYRDFSLKNYNSFKLESYVKEIYFPESLHDLQGTLLILKNKKFGILAGGTNVILKPEIKRVICLKKLPQELNFYKIGTIASVSVPTSYFILKAIEHKVIGIEGLIGIPGTIGGAVVMNAGSGKYTISDYLLAVTTMDYNGNLHVYGKELLNFGRRYSILQEKNEILIEVLFDFKTGTPKKAEIEKAIYHRKTIPQLPSAGGVFLNWHSLKPYKDKLIGLRVGDAEVSKSLNIIVNRGNVTFDDIMTLIEKINNIVNIPLKMEVKVIG